MTLEERLRPATRFAPEVASLNMGSMGFGLFPMLNRYKDFKYEWEAQVLEASRDLVFKNSYKDIEGLLALLTPLGTRFEFECYDTSHLYNLAHFLDRGLVKAPLFVQTCFGILGGIGSHPDDIMHMKRTADRLFGDQYERPCRAGARRQAEARGIPGRHLLDLESRHVRRQAVRGGDQSAAGLHPRCRHGRGAGHRAQGSEDRKSTRLNSSH